MRMNTSRLSDSGIGKVLWIVIAVTVSYVSQYSIPIGSPGIVDRPGKVNTLYFSSRTCRNTRASRHYTPARPHSRANSYRKVASRAREKSKKPNSEVFLLLFKMVYKYKRKTNQAHGIRTV